MNKTLRTLAFTSAVALFGGSAYATGNHQEPVKTPPAPTQSQGQGQSQGQSQSQGQNQGQNQGQSQQANGTGIGVGISDANAAASAGATAGAKAETGAITNTNGANAETGPITNTNGANAQTGTIDVKSAGGAANAATGPITVAPSQSTVNSFRSFVGTNAPNLSGAVDNCLAVVGWSFSANVFGSTGVGLGGGNQRAEFIEQCSAVKSAFEVWNRANGDVAKETFAIEMLIKALPNYAKPAMDAAVERINAYTEKNGDAEPDSVMSIFGAKAFKKKELPPAPLPAVNNGAQQQQNGVTLIVNPVVHTVETHTKETRVVVKQPKPVVPAALAPDCGCKK